MRKLLLISILSLICLSTAMAQEPAICGDWVGVYKNVARNDKRYIRVKLIDGNFTIRMKTRIADDSEPFYYWPECHIIEANDRMIRWKMDMESSYDWTPSDKHKGIPIGHTDYYKYCTIILSNGTLKYSEYMLTIYYDRQGREIDKQKWFEEDGQTLYKEDSDW